MTCIGVLKDSASLANYVELSTDRLCLTGDNPTCMTPFFASNTSRFETYDDRWDRKRCGAEPERSFTA